MKKELPCPHCGQNLHLAANTTAQLMAADELAKAVRSHGHTKRHWGRESCCVMCDKLEAYEALKSSGPGER